MENLITRINNNSFWENISTWFDNLNGNLNVVIPLIGLIAGIVLYCMLKFDEYGRFLAAIMSIISLSFLIYAMINVYNNTNKTNTQPVQINEIKDLIHIDDDKLTIDPLTNKSNNLKYTNSKYDKDKKQIFKITKKDEFYEKYKLVDYYNNEIIISKEEYEELTKDGN